MERKYQDSIVPAGNAAFRLLLTHSPEIMKDYLVSGFNLVLAGGTHGGRCAGREECLLEERIRAAVARGPS